MKSLLLPLSLCAALAGCATYVDPYGAGYGYNTYPGYTTTYPHAYGVYEATPYPVYPNEVRGRRDRDRDGIPNRVDADRDGDGVPNHRDARPNNPRRY